MIIKAVETSINAFSFVALLGYIMALIFVIQGLFSKSGPNRKKVTCFAGVAVTMHAAALWTAIITPNGQNFSMLHVVSLINWVISFAFTLLMFRLRIVTVVPAVYLCSVASVALLWIAPANAVEHFDLKPEVLTHVAFSLIAYSILMISALYAIQLQITQSLLKQKKLNLVFWLPPLLTVEKHVLSLVMLGVVLLSLSLASGFVFLEHIFGQGQGHKTILSLIAWCIYVVMLWRHHQYGSTPRAAVGFTLTGACLLTLAYFGARVVKEIILVKSI